jgi:hypothetical protein
MAPWEVGRQDSAPEAGPPLRARLQYRRRRCRHVFQRRLEAHVVQLSRCLLDTHAQTLNH